MQTQETIQDFSRTLRQMLSDSERVRSFGDKPFSADEITAYLRQFKSADKERTRYGIADILTNVLIANIDFSKDEIEFVFNRKVTLKNCIVD